MIKTETKPSRDGLARIPEACQFLGVSRATAYSLMGKGELPYAKIGKCRRVPWAALEKLVARNLVGAEN